MSPDVSTSSAVRSSARNRLCGLNDALRTQISSPIPSPRPMKLGHGDTVTRRNIFRRLHVSDSSHSVDKLGALSTPGKVAAAAAVSLEASCEASASSCSGGSSATAQEMLVGGRSPAAAGTLSNSGGRESDSASALQQTSPGHRLPLPALHEGLEPPPPVLLGVVGQGTYGTVYKACWRNRMVCVVCGGRQAGT